MRDRWTLATMDTRSAIAGAPDCRVRLLAVAYAVTRNKKAPPIWQGYVGRIAALLGPLFVYVDVRWCFAAAN